MGRILAVSERPKPLALAALRGEVPAMPRGRLHQATAFLIDMDGTLYLDEELLPGARELVEELRSRGHAYLFMTNNSSRGRGEYLERLSRLRIPAGPDSVLTSGDATIAYLLRETSHRSAYVVGTPSLIEDFAGAGIRVEEDDPDCVVLGFDTGFDYAKLANACRLLFAGKPYFATHPDKTCITRSGLVPDIAALIAACEAVTGRSPMILGKPTAEMVRAGLQRLGVSEAEAVIVGDQLDTDIAMGKDSGVLSVLVMTGETSRDQLDAWPPERHPDLVAADAAELLDWLRTG